MTRFARFRPAHCAVSSAARAALLHALLGLGSVSFGASLLTWDVTGTTGASSGSAPASLAAGLSGSAITGGGSTGNSTSPASTWNRTYALVADATEAQTAGNYFSWTTTVEAGYTANFNGITGLNLSRTSVGPTSAELYYSTDGVTYTKTGSTATVTAVLTSAGPAFDDTMAVTPIVLAAGESGPATLHWRLVVYGGTSASRLGIGRAGTDDFTLLGTVTGGSAKDLVWGGGDGAWNTSAGNTPWTFASAPSAFATNDNVTISTPATLTVDAGGVTAGSVAVANETGLVTFTSGSVTATTLAKSGAGTLALEAANTLSGGFSATGGVVRLSHPGAFGTPSATLDGVTLEIAPVVTALANNLGIGQADATIQVAADATATLSGIVSAAGVSAGPGVLRGDPQTFNTLRKTGAGKLVFSANVGTQMSYDTTAQNVTAAGGIALQIVGGSVELGSNRTYNLASGIVRDGLDPVTSEPTVYNGMQWDGDVLLRGATVQINGGNIRGSGVITVGVAGETAATNTLAHRFNFNSPDIANPVVVTAGHTLTLSAAANGSLVLSGPVSGAGTITTAGTGTVRVITSTPSTFTGTFINNGRMELSAPALAAAAAVNNAGTLTLDNRLVDTGAVVAAPITGAGSVTKTSDGVVVLTGANTFSGGLVLASLGGVFVNDPASFGSGQISSNHAGGKIGLASASAASVTMGQALNTGTVNADLNLFPGLTIEPGAGKTLEATGPVSGTGQLKLVGGGQLTLSGALSYAGDTTVDAGTLRIQSANTANDASAVHIGVIDARLDLAFTGSDTVNALYIGSTQQAAGTYGATGSGATYIDDTRFAGTGVLSVTSSPAITDPFVTWASGYGLTGPSAETTADPDGDGLNNLLEYATASDPTVAGVVAVNLGRSGDRLTLTYTRVADPALVYTVDAVDELTGTWAPLVVDGNPSTGSANIAGTVIVTDTVSVSAQPRRFLRLRVSR
ncbi:MAG: autotransporter-associated beta strand repeat-containing protein [Opitutaceae bacterium]|jgi:autotransporter-associated beta strand protein|nr:autotransporter-associated beta strand repeat-containing protein [Opitutaceae bacterium]